MLVGGVSEQTIYNWESEGTALRAGHLRGLATVRSRGKREAQAKLEAFLAQAALRGKGKKKR